MKSSGTAARTAATTSLPKRIRFSNDPPYSSVRVLIAGFQNCSIRCANEVTSTPSQPQRWRRSATSTNRWTSDVQLLDAEGRGDLAVLRFRQIRHTADGSHHLPRGATMTHVGGLGNDQATVGVHTLSDPAQLRLVPRIPQRDRAVGRRGRGVDRGRAEGHHQPDTTFSLADEVVGFLVRDQATWEFPTGRVRGWTRCGWESSYRARSKG